jgi:hemerythrin
MAAFPWSDTYLLGYAPMDDTHREFVGLVNVLLTCNDAELAAHLDDAWMERTDFPPRDCHVQEHAAVMSSVRQVIEIVAQGNVAEGRRLAAALGDWFPGHAFHLDSALAHWMVKRSHGGKPVVLRRNVLAREEG